MKLDGMTRANMWMTLAERLWMVGDGVGRQADRCAHGALNRAEALLWPRSDAARAERVVESLE